MYRHFFIVILAVIALFSTHRSEGKVIDERIYLIPAGDVDRQTIDTIKERLPGCLPMTVKIGIAPQERIPESAYTASRSQYLAEMVLDDISKRINLDTNVESALIITDVDLYSPDLNFVFGVADRSKRVGVISLTRLRNEFYGLKPDKRLFLDRVVKEAVHELGHAWGLEHCPDRRCVMYFSNSLVDTDKKENSFCTKCRKDLERRYSTPLFAKLL